MGDHVWFDFGYSIITHWGFEEPKLDHSLRWHLKDAPPAPDDILDDGCGNRWSEWCPTCKQKTMSIVRPGKVQCNSDECNQPEPPMPEMMDTQIAALEYPSDEPEPPAPIPKPTPDGVPDGFCQNSCGYFALVRRLAEWSRTHNKQGLRSISELNLIIKEANRQCAGDVK